MHVFADKRRLLGGVGPDALRWLGAMLAAFLMLVLPAALRSPAVSEAGRIVGAEILTPQAGWQSVDLDALKLPKGRISVLRARIEMPPAVVAAGRPMALYLSGVFSADAVWNGNPIGSKGRPGASTLKEVPGPIDAVIPLPAGALKPNQNVLTLHLSGERLAAGHSVIHGQGGIFGMRVAPFSADARRPIGYYATPFLMSGVLLLALVLVAFRGRLRSPATVILAGLLICAVAELSRSIIDYPYPLQALRMSGVKAGAAMICLGCGLLALHSIAWRPPTNWRRLGTAGAGLLALTAPVDAPGLVFAGALAGGLIIGVSAVRRRDGPLFLQAGALLLIAAASRLTRPDFMDQGLYAASAPLIAEFLWRIRASPSVVLDLPRAASLIVGPPAARRFLDLQTIRAIHAAGDYVEISLTNGRRLLESHGLSALAARLPPSFLRVHRSHIVNLAHSEELRSEGGGRYRLRVGDSLWVPVSRTRIAELRERLGC